MKNKDLILDTLIHGEYSLDAAPEALRFAQQSGVLKILLKAPQIGYS